MRVCGRLISGPGGRGTLRRPRGVPRALRGSQGENYTSTLASAEKKFAETYSTKIQRLRETGMDVMDVGTALLAEGSYGHEVAELQRYLQVRISEIPKSRMDGSEKASPDDLSWLVLEPAQQRG